MMKLCAVVCAFAPERSPDTTYRESSVNARSHDIALLKTMARRTVL